MRGFPGGKDRGLRLGHRAAALGGLIVAVTAGASAGEWWTRPWDYMVSPNPDRKRQWHLECVNDLGGTPEKDNQRDISKSLGRVRKFREQTLFRIYELREAAEVAAMGKGPAAETVGKAAPFFEKAEALAKRAIPLQRQGKTGEVARILSEAKRLLNRGETIMETAIAVMEDRNHVRHLRNAILYAEMPRLAREIDALEARIEKDAGRAVADLRAAVAEQQGVIDLLKRKLASMRVGKEYVSEFTAALDLYQYLLDTASKGGEKTRVYDGDQVPLDAAHPDLELGVVGSVARRIGQLRFRLRQLSNRMSALARSPVTGSVSDGISAGLGFPIDDLDHFTRSKFGWVKANRLIDNEVWDWEFNYAPPEADAISIAGRWDFQIDPKFVGEQEGWFRPGFSTRGWRNIYAPNWWEREGVTDYNNLDNIFVVHKKVTGGEYPKRGHGAKNADHRHYNGVGWYRKRVYIPKGWAGADVKLRGGVMNGMFRFYMNGQLSGRRWQNSWWGLRDLNISAGAIRFGAVNDIAICCYNASSVGGLAEGPLWLVKGGGKASFRRTPLPGGYVKEESYGAPGGEYRVNLVMSAMSPGSILATDSNTFHMWGWRMKGYAAPTEAVFAGAGGPRTVRLDGSKRITTGAEMKENWLLLNVGRGHGNPLLVVFQRKPSRVAWRADELREGLVVTFPGAAGQVGVIHAGRNGQAKDALVKSARHWSRAMLAYPEHASEFWKVHPDRKNMHFEIMGEFNLVYNYHVIEDEWGTEPLKTAGLPVLSCYALDYKYPGFAEGEAERTGVPVRFQAYAKCEFRSKSGTDRLSYTAPCADHATLWKGIGTFTEREVTRTDRRGEPKKYWSVAETKKWGSNNNRLALHVWSRLQGGEEKWWDLGFQYGFDGDILPPEHDNWKRFDRIVQDHVENDLFLILDAFPDDQGVRPGDDTCPQTGRWMRLHPKTIPSQVKLWKYIAARYKNVSPRHFGYNFYNEPAYIDPEMYNKAIKAITRGIREVEREKWITHDMGDGWAQPNWMFGTKPTGDPKTVYQYHFYYKHDGIVHGAPEWFYPQWSDGKPFFYMNSKECFIAELVDTLVYQTVHHVPTWCGEFGGSVNNPNQECLIWLEDHIQHMERMGQGWSWWNWDGRGYGRTGLRGGELVSPNVLVLRRFMRRKGAF